MGILEILRKQAARVEEAKAGGITEYSALLRKAKRSDKETEHLLDLAEALGFAPAMVELHALVLTEAAALEAQVKQADEQAKQADEINKQIATIRPEFERLRDKINALAEQMRDLRSQSERADVQRDQLHDLKATFIGLFPDAEPWPQDAWQYREPMLTGAIINAAQERGLINCNANDGPAAQLAMGR